MNLVFTLISVCTFFALSILGTKSQINLKEYKGSHCKRQCVKGDDRICYFEFTMEYYQANGVACANCTRGIADDCNKPQCVVGDGVENGFMAINRQLPGPPIHVCPHDLVVVDLINSAPGTATTIHWHGLHMVETPFMDGVPYVTQCPIPFSTTFRYQFRPRQYGTYFYHSHAGFHRPNGIYGAFIIRQPIENDPLAFEYDYDLPEHTLVISDWLHHHVEWLWPGIPSFLNKPNAVLLNGRGTFLNSTTGKRVSAPPPQIICVEPQKRYRFRTIAAHSFNCPMQLQVQSHMLRVIATDGADVEPMEFDTIILNAGERYDFVLDTNQKHGDYWIRVRGIGVCDIYVLTEAFVLLRYKDNDDNNTCDKPAPDFPAYNEIYQINDQLNYPNKSCNNMTQDGCVTELKSIFEDTDLRYAEPDEQIFLGFNNWNLTKAEVFGSENYEHFRNLEKDILELSAFNKITFINPSSPLLSQLKEVNASEFCSANNLPKKCKNIRYCPCVHLLKLQLGSVVEMFLIDQTDAYKLIHHPMHIHGLNFMVTDIGQRPENSTSSDSGLRGLMQQVNKYGVLPGHQFNERAPFKDTLSIPTKGYAVIRFRATNPGYWFMHCHYEFHAEMGMALVLQIGEPSDMPKKPRNFPKCGNYLSNVVN